MSSAPATLRTPGPPGGAADRWARALTWLALAAAAACLYLPRPFLLGFYHDDWCMLEHFHDPARPFSWPVLREMLATHTGRPLYALGTWLSLGCCGASPARWQAAL